MFVAAIVEGAAVSVIPAIEPPPIPPTPLTKIVDDVEGVFIVGLLGGECRILIFGDSEIGKIRATIHWIIILYRIELEIQSSSRLML